MHRFGGSRCRDKIHTIHTLFARPQTGGGKRADNGGRPDGRGELGTGILRNGQFAYSPVLVSEEGRFGLRGGTFWSQRNR
jgi:hypothetical protein